MSRADRASGFNPYQREYQITIPSSEPVRAKGAEMIDATKQRRNFQGRSFNKQSFYNCIILGLYDVESKRDVDQADIDSKGLLAIIVDRGASELAKMIASSDAPLRPRGAPVAIDLGDDDEEEEGARETPIAAAPSRPTKPPLLIVPRNWTNRRRDVVDHGARGGAEEKHEPVGRRPLP